MSVLGQPTDAAHLPRIENKQHECFLRYFPFALYSMWAGAFESESRIVFRVSYHDDDREPGLLELLVTRFDQFGADALPLV